MLGEMAELRRFPGRKARASSHHMQLRKPSIVEQQSTELNMPPPLKPLFLIRHCRLGISRIDDKAEVSWVKQDTTSLHYVFLFIKAPAFIHPQGRLHFVIVIIFLQLFSTETAKCLPTHIHTHTYTFTSITRMEKIKQTRNLL